MEDNLLFNACLKNDINTINNLIENKADINVFDKAGGTLLCMSCYYNLIDVVKLLIDKGALINIQCKNKLTAIYYTCNKDNVELFDLLVKNGADLNIKIHDNYDLVNHAYTKNSIKILEYLIDNKHCDLLRIACISSGGEGDKPSLNIIKHFIENYIPSSIIETNSDLYIETEIKKFTNEVNCYTCDIPNNSRYIPKDNIEIVRYIYGIFQRYIEEDVKRAKEFNIKLEQSGSTHKISCKPKNNSVLNISHLIDMCYLNNIKIVKFMIESGMDVNCSYFGNQVNPLKASCLYERGYDTLLYLLEQNADLFQYDSCGCAIMHNYIFRTDIIAIILEWYEN